MKILHHSNLMFSILRCGFDSFLLLQLHLEQNEEYELCCIIREELKNWSEQTKIDLPIDIEKYILNMSDIRFAWAHNKFDFASISFINYLKCKGIKVDDSVTVPDYERLTNRLQK